MRSFLLVSALLFAFSITAQGADSGAPNTATIDKLVQSMGGSQGNSAEIYSIGRDVMQKLVNETGDDPAKMQLILDRAKTDPEGFYRKYFSDQDKARLKDVSGQMSPTPSSSP